MEEENRETIVVAGASGSMGTKLAGALVENGYNVLGMGRNLKVLERLRLEYHPNFKSLCVDFNSDELEALLKDKLASFAPFAGFVQLSGISRGNQDIESMSLEDWHGSFNVNVHSAFYILRVLIPILKVKKKGSIVLVSSPVGVKGANKASYSASKAALSGLGISLARTLGAYNIRVNTLLPGATITNMTSDWSEAKRKQVAGGSFLKRLCTPEEIANVVLFLLSDQSSYITGSTIDVTAGSIWS